jgi:serine/threonine-protein kinase
VESSPTTDLTGRKIGEYEITAKLGVGGMGVVYEGKQPLIGKRVAVKVLLPSLSQEKELVERFLSEARAVNEIRHRGIVDIFSFGQLPEGTHYFVMEYLQGDAFDKIIKKRAPLPVGEALRYMEEVLDALDAAHSAGIIHRDIKPSNIFLVDTGRGRPYVKLLDFGIAKLGALQGESTPQTRASAIVGTPDYISPEQAKGLPIAPATDVYAIACVLHELLTKKRLFKGENQLQTMWMHVEDKPPLASSLNPLVPKALDDVLQWALEKKIENRPASAEEFRQHLEAIRRTLPEEQSPATPAPITGRGRPLTSENKSHTPAPISRSKMRPAVPPAQLLAEAARTTFVGPQGNAPAVAADPEEGLRTQIKMDGVEPTAVGPVPKVAAPAAPTAVNDTAAELEPVPPSRLPLVAGVVGLLVVAAIVAVVVLVKKESVPEVPIAPVEEAPKAKSPEPVKAPVVDAKPPEKVPEPVKVAAPEPVKAAEPVKTLAEKTPVVEAKPPEKGLEAGKVPEKGAAAPVKTGGGLTQAQLEARLSKLVVKLGQKEAATGEVDRVMRQFLDQAKADVAAAQTEAQRREAWKFLDEVSSQLGK